MSRRTLLALAVAVALVPAVAPAGEYPPGEEPCHLLCVTEAGRVESRFVSDALDGPTLWLRVQAAYLQPQGIYLTRRYEPIRHGHAWAVQTMPSLTWFPRDGLAVTAGLPFEYNVSRGVVLPTLLPAGRSNVELARGRAFASVRARVPVGESWSSTPWIGGGYAVSHPIGTVEVGDDLDDVPQTGIEALGVGSDDLFLTTYLVGRTPPGWSAVLGLEARLHMLPRWQRAFAMTAASTVWIARDVGPRWSAGVRLGGYRTFFPHLPVAQSALTVVPTVTHEVGRNLRLSAGVSSEVPGVAVNENALQTVGGHLTFEAGF